MGVMIIGGGLTGMSAAIYMVRAGACSLYTKRANDSSQPSAFLLKRLTALLMISE